VIPEDEIEQAVEWLRANARKAAQARAERIYVEQYRKTIKAQLMVELLERDPKETIAAQERFAYSHPNYVQHLSALRAAVEEDEKMQWLRAAAEAKIEAWRSQCANQRVEGKAYAP
jgi:hypothetical protein